MGLNTSKISLERGMNIFTIPRDTLLIQDKETGPGTNHGNPPRPKLPVWNCPVELGNLVVFNCLFHLINDLYLSDVVKYF